MIYLYNDIEYFNDNDYIAAYRLLSNDRKEQVDRYHFFKDKRLCILAYVLLVYGLKKEAININVPLCFEYGKYGKPFLRNVDNIHFNLSHCEKSVACVISNEYVGVDVQNFIDNSNQIEKIVMSICEVKKIKKSVKPDLAFTRFWTIKESYLKLIGNGLNDKINELDFSKYNEDMFQYDNYFFYITRFKEYYLSVCQRTSYISEIEIISIGTLREFFASFDDF